MSRISSLFTWSFLFFSSLSFVLAIDRSHFPPHPADPYADPKNDPYNPLRYIASNVLTAISFSLVLIVAISQSVLTWRFGGKYMLAMTIACYTFAVGLGLRFGLHAQPESKGIYIAEYLFVVLSPCGFIAANYVLLGRLSGWMKGDAHLWINPRRITLVFVLSDVVTFLIQAAGGGVSINNDPRIALKGSRIFLAGLVLQLLSFIIFSILYVRFLWRVRKYEPAIWTRDSGISWFKDWRSLAGALIISCIGILIRSVYRTVELSQGYHGTLATSETFFYALDTLPLFVAITIFLPFWPGRYIPDHIPVKDVEESSKEEVEMT
ncbi:RTA1-like protein [Cristinia sonorae]|uniref:RTA1-like protein n=1 Tax=Cristinia sonorae TaxID=1940300 RepID=A0A8K0XLL8_9AGAR|nr:RTA1-like protein [Cristinia sonorae]